MHLVDEVDLVAAAGWSVLHILQQLPGVLYLGARRGVHLQQVDTAPLGDFQAGGTLAAGFGTDPSSPWA